MAGEDKIRALQRGGREITQDQSCTYSFSHLVRIEIGQDGSDQKLIFYTDPRDALIECRVFTTKPEIHIWARLALLPVSAEVILEIHYDVQTKKFRRLNLGGRSLLDSWRQGKIGQWSRLLTPNISYDTGLLKELGDLKLSDPDEEEIEGVLVSFASFLDPVSRQPGNKHWTPVLECLAELDDKSHLTAFGTRFEFSEDERTIRLVQVPRSLVNGREEPGLDARTWIVGVMGVPYVWGRSVWNDLLGEQVQASELDFQHGSLFTPLLLEEAGSNSHLDWNLVYEKTENIAPGLPGRQSVLRSMQLSSRIDNKGMKVRFPLLRNHLSSAIEAEVIPPHLFLSAREIGTREQTAARLEWVVDAVFRPGLSLTPKKDVHLKLPENAANRSVRIGALDITFAHRALPRRSQAQPELRWDFIPSHHRPELEGRYQPREAFIEIDWAVESIVPGGQDDLPGEPNADCDRSSLEALRGADRDERMIECDFRRERPVVIPLNQQPALQGKANLILNVSERARLRDLRRIDLTLRRPDGQGGSSPSQLRELEVCDPVNELGLDRVAVLDREPFLVAKVSFPALGSLKDPAADNVIANWRSHGHDAGAWHIRFPDAQNFCLALPPQGIGETMEKSRTLGDSALADFRLSPPALLSMRESFFRQSFPEAPWNLRRLLGDPGRELPGAHLEHLQYELLYGLSCRIDYPFMRLAELSALVGDMVGPLPQRPAWVPLTRDAQGIERPDPNDLRFYNKARAAWAGISRNARRRLGVFELWDIRRLDTLELRENVACWIRQLPAVDTKNPIELVKVPPADLSNPISPANDGKLKGGVTWGFESRNVYQAVVREGPGRTWPKSSGAEMRETRLSALGGSGHKMAAFDNWRTKIFADVATGRTYSYTLERIGRIAVWWNRAKHVIIYERSVVPSRQFAGDQNALSGRAVLRKVEEYVEILQNNRKYPDKGKGDSKATGFVTECSFSDDPNQIVRFRVKSSWGADVGNEGWKVPIWRLGETPSDLYPKPVVNLQVMASVDGESMRRKVTIADPENLYFFTDTTVPPEALENPSFDLSNTDDWEPVEGVDYVDEARPRPMRDKAFETGSLRQASPGDSALPVGFRPCTFLIEPAEHTVDLLANRPGDPMGALLSSVTLCRAQLGETKTGLTSVVESARSILSDEIKGHLDFLPAEASRFNAEELRQRLDAICTTIGAKVDSAIQGPAARLKEGSDRLQQVGQNIEALVKKLDEQATEKIVAESKRLAAFPRRVVEELKADKDALKQTLRQEIERARAQVALMPSPAGYLVSVETALHEARQQVTVARDRLAAIVGTSVDEWVTSARLPELIQRLQGCRSELRSLSQRLRGLADSGATLGNGDRNLALGIGPRSVLKKLEPEKIAAVLERVEAALASAEKVAAGAQEHAALAKSRLAQLKAQQDILSAKIDELKGLLGTVRQKIVEAEGIRLEKFTALTTEVLRVAEAKIDALSPERMVEDLRESWEVTVTSQADALRIGLHTGLNNIRATTREFFENVSIDELIPSATSVRTAVEAQCTDLKNRFAAVLQEIGDGLGVEGKLAEVRSFLERQRDEAVRQVEEQLGGGVKAARQLIDVVESKRDDVLKLVRAFGKPPEVSGLEFDRPEVAFFFNEVKDRVDITPVIARAAQAAAIVEALKPFGIDLPVQELGEQLIPAELRNFDLSSILPNIAGIPLQNLFSGLKMPAGSGDAVKVRHGVDPQTRRAWVNTEVNFQAQENATLFAVGPLAVRIDKPHFQAQARLEADPRGIQQRRVRGQLAGDWLLQIGGFPLITFKQTPLEFDEAGRVNFRVNPKDVQLAPALDFINDLMTTISPGGLTTRFDGDGVVSTLDLPIPDTQLGAFGFSGLRLGASLALRYSGGDFNIGVTASLGRRDAPFTLTVFVLGGAGYLELGSRYHPSTGQVVATADMAIAASASLAIALGPIRGGVAVYVGVTAQYDSSRGGGLVVGLMFMVRGHVSVLSIASATITLRLDGQYQGGAMVGRGHLEIKIKICWCFTLEVSESVTYTLGRVGSNQRAWLGGPRPVAQIASLDAWSADFADPPGDAVTVTELDPEALREGVKAYLDMLV